MAMEIRVASPEDAEEIAKVKIATWRAAYAHILDPEVLASLDLAREAGLWRERILAPTLACRLWVAVDDAQVIGYVVVGPNRFHEVACDGELQAIYVRPGTQRRGIGKQLLRVAVDWMVDQGFKSMAVFVFRDNPIGVGFYKSMGAEFNDSGDLEIGGKRYADESYVWPSLQELKQSLAR